MNAIDAGDVVTSFNPSGPPKGTGLHRYAFMIFKQDSKQEIWSSPASRGKFDVKKMASEHNLGEKPVAYNFYKTKRE